METEAAVADVWDWVERQRERMVSLVRSWSEINSGTWNQPGVLRMAEAIRREFAECGLLLMEQPVQPAELVHPSGVLEQWPLGPVLSARCRPEAERRVLLAIHYDTVYPADSPFQSVQQTATQMHGPGVTDAKGGLVVLLIAVQALERFVEQTGLTGLGWEVLLNADEEIGSPGSASLLEAAAQRNQLGLLYEPSLPSGELAGARKGSANFHLACRGKSAHAGRHFHEGINAVAAAAEIAHQLHQWNGRWPETTINVARIDGGGPLNMVPDAAVVRFNIRYGKAALEAELAAALEEVQNQARASGVECQLQGSFNTPPKKIDAVTERLFGQIFSLGESQGLSLNYTSTGGVCDGNRLAAHGLPNVDTLGVRGGGIHSEAEFLLLDSLTERARLSAALLIGWTSGTLPWPRDL